MHVVAVHEGQVYGGEVPAWTDCFGRIPAETVGCRAIKSARMATLCEVLIVSLQRVVYCCQQT